MVMQIVQAPGIRGLSRAQEWIIKRVGLTGCQIEGLCVSFARGAPTEGTLGRLEWQLSFKSQIVRCGGFKRLECWDEAI